MCASVRACVRVCVCASFPFGFEDRMWDPIVLIPDHCLLFTLDWVQGDHRRVHVLKRISTF